MVDCPLPGIGMPSRKAQVRRRLSRIWSIFPLHRIQVAIDQGNLESIFGPTAEIWATFSSGAVDFPVEEEDPPRPVERFRGA